MQRLGKSELAVLILCGALVFLTIGAVGEQGRRRAKEVVCQTNLRQWHDIFQGYIDPNGAFISGDRGSPGYWWVKYLSEEHKDWERTRIWFCPQAQRPVMDQSGRIGSTTSVFNAWGIFTGPGLGSIGISGSYALNGYVIPLPVEEGTRVSGRGPPSPPRAHYESGVPATEGWRDLRDVPNGNTVPMFVDALRFDLWPLPTDPPAEYEFALWSGRHMARCAINRHDAAVSCLFVDGSVRKVGLKELWTLKWHRSFNTEGPWTRAGGVLPDHWPEWIRPFKDY
jgi:hypothetical protein